MTEAQLVAQFSWGAYLPMTHNLAHFQCDQIGQFIALRQLFKACGNNYFDQIAHILGTFCRGVKIFHFSSGIIFG